MTFKILDQYKIINGVTDSSFGPINPFSQVDAEQGVVKFLKSLGWRGISEKDVIFADQVHKDGIRICQKGDSGSIRLGVDALVSNHKGQILVIKTADCLPILIYDPVQKVVAAIHGGRKSLTLGIISKTIDKMRENLSVNPKNLRVAIGPHIRKCHYFLKPKRIEELSKTKWKKYFIKPKAPLRGRNDKVYFDTTKAGMDELTESGVLKENIEDSGICTFEHYKKYYSARKKEEDQAVYKEKLPCFASIIGMRR